MNTADGAQGDLLGNWFRAKVIDRDDPRSLGRVKARTAVSPTGWLYPLGGAAGPNGRGFFAIPKVGDLVLIHHYLGNPDNGYYIPANWTVGQLPEGGDPDVITISSDDYTITIDERAASAGLTIIDRQSGDRIAFSKNGLSLDIEATASISITSKGQISITAPSVIINGRPVIPGAGPI